MPGNHSAKESAGKVLNWAFAVEDTDAKCTEQLRQVKMQLRRHQLVGLAWMKIIEIKESNYGIILADEVGLGKTATSISLMLSSPLWSKGGKQVNLVVRLFVCSVLMEQGVSECDFSRTWTENPCLT